MGRDLVKDIKSETSGEFENTLSSLLMKPDDYDASELRHALTVCAWVGVGKAWPQYSTLCAIIRKVVCLLSNLARFTYLSGAFHSAIVQNKWAQEWPFSEFPDCELLLSGFRGIARLIGCKTQITIYYFVCLKSPEFEQFRFVLQASPVLGRGLAEILVSRSPQQIANIKARYQKGVQRCPRPQTILADLFSVCVHQTSPQRK
jgi:hypothetical protein